MKLLLSRFIFFKRTFTACTIILALLLVFSCSRNSNSILVFAGSASMPATEEVAALFEQESGIHVNLNFGGSGTLLSQMMLSKSGDIYFPGSSDFMEIARHKGLVDTNSEIVVGYLIPCINVAKDNPKHIQTLADLAQPSLRFVMANPENVCLGIYSVELIESNCNPVTVNEIRNNILTYTESCSKTAATLGINSADAIIGWRVFGYWNPEHIENILLPDSQIVRIGYLPAAMTSFTEKRKNSQLFLNFMVSEKAKEIFKKHHYIVEKEEATKFGGKDTKFGGIYLLPDSWKNNFKTQN